VPPAVDPAVVEQARLAREAAERQVEAFRAQAEQATQVLTEGSQRLAVEQDELARVQSAQATAARRADDALAAAANARARLSVMIGQAYMNPVPDPVQLALTSSPESVADAVVARADLDRVRGSSTDVLREANGARVAADAAVRTAAQLSQQAAQKKAAVEAQVAQLRSYALRSEQALQAASVALASAQQLEQVAVADAAAAENARKAREAALAAALANRGVLATCTAQPTGTLVNGFLDPSLLCPLDDAPGKALQPTAAAAFNAMNAAYKAQTGTPICVTDSYRSYAEQVRVYAEKPELAAVPGRSNHGLGLALDLCGGVQDFGSAAHLWMKMNAGRFGWFHPAWAEPGGAKPEPWHWEYADGDYTSVQPAT
jgi:LAS superfamily LD-carboxypeptidase LdcB